jgi:hypothetical protein
LLVIFGDLPLRNQSEEALQGFDTRAGGPADPDRFQSGD